LAPAIVAEDGSQIQPRSWAALPSGVCVCVCVWSSPTPSPRGTPGVTPRAYENPATDETRTPIVFSETFRDVGCIFRLRGPRALIHVSPAGIRCVPNTTYPFGVRGTAVRTVLYLRRNSASGDTATIHEPAALPPFTHTASPPFPVRSIVVFHPPTPALAVSRRPSMLDPTPPSLLPQLQRRHRRRQESLWVPA
jgi:hypothetical protein